MRNKHNNRILGRKPHHRKALMRNLTSSLLQHRSIVTTEAKAKELRRYAEPLITKAKGDMTLARRRALLAKLQHTSDLPALVEIAESHKDRPGGYLRLTKLPISRADAAREVRVEVVSESRTS